mmetsp:Transcript_2264/g.3757  ORF Transcript_2264/g.3757 Transcript_2264/m.3757 type:complete len:326 (-) Transcript_2264:29-1006(-)
MSGEKKKLDLSNLSKLDKYQKKKSKYPVEDWPQRYAPIRILGKGHDGLCYLCEDVETNKPVAVKVLNPKRNRRITEPELMAGLSHPHIVCVKSHFMVRQFNFLVLEYCSKGDLCDYVYDNEYLSERETRKFMLQLIDGVAYLHDQGICHRDLKLDNIFLDKDYNVKIGDFGASCRFDQNTKLTYRCGTTQYNAPELVKNQGYFGDEVDCWALGIIMYVMLVGKFPFDCDTDMQLLWQVLKGIKFPESRSLTHEAKDLIRQCTEPKPSQRATLAVMLEHDWFRLGSTTATTASSSSTSALRKASSTTQSDTESSPRNEPVADSSKE